MKFSPFYTINENLTAAQDFSSQGFRSVFAELWLWYQT